MRLALVALVVALFGATHVSTLPSSPTVSPDGAHVAWVDGFTWQVYVARADGSNVHKVGKPWPEGVGQLTWTRHGLLVDSNYTLFLLTQRGVEVKIGVVGDQVFSVGGAHAASGSAPCGSCKGQVTVYDIRTHTAVRLGDPKQANEDPALSPDGARVAYSGRHGIVVQPARGGPARTVRAFGGCERWSPDGRSLAYYDRDNLAVVPVAGGKPTLLLRKAVCGMYPAWSPDSRTIALTYGPDRLALVDVRTHAVRKTPTTIGRVVGAGWLPDGSALLVSLRHGDDACGTLALIDARTLAATPLVRGCP